MPRVKRLTIDMTYVHSADIELVFKSIYSQVKFRADKGTSTVQRDSAKAEVHHKYELRLQEPNIEEINGQKCLIFKSKM